MVYFPKLEEIRHFPPVSPDNALNLSFCLKAKE